MYVVLAGEVKYLWRPDTAERKKQGCFKKGCYCRNPGFFLEKGMMGRRGL